MGPTSWPVPPPSYHWSLAQALHLDAQTLVTGLNLLVLCQVAVQVAQAFSPPLHAGVCVLALPVCGSYAVTASPTTSRPIACAPLGVATGVFAEHERGSRLSPHADLPAPRSLRITTDAERASLQLLPAQQLLRGRFPYDLVLCAQ
jgi:hypothetical protein